jgi:hypothetical protein
MKRNSIILLIIILFLSSSCRRGDFGEVSLHESDSEFGSDGFWVVNEGLFGFGNGEISFINPKKDKSIHGVFQGANGIPPGDIPMDLLIDNNIGILTVNNAGKVWILKKR